LNTRENLEFAAFVPAGGAVLNDVVCQEREMLLFGREEGVIEMKNSVDAPVEIIVFGGAPYTEPIVAQGPFVMNSQDEIATAYNDFFEGKYGEIQYSQEAD
jgi:redox-sensitive bicupin YhaK (pirin superfamily)